jgi:hypothetical protein
MPWPFRRKPAPPPANTVVIADDVAASLLMSGAPLESAVNDALREHIEAKAREATEAEARGIPFWLRRDSERGGDIEEQLRDRVIQRRSSEEGGG